jgi:acyl-homoserine lactone synthase
VLLRDKVGKDCPRSNSTTGLMKLLVLTGTQLALDVPLQTAVFRRRHQVFVEKLGWEAIRRPDGLEVDEFDTPEAVHVIVVDSNTSDDPKILSYTRLLPTTAPHLLSSVYPELMGDRQQDIPVGEDIWEWTRTLPVPVPLKKGEKRQPGESDLLPFRVTPAYKIMIIGAFEWAVANNIRVLTAQGHPMIVDMYVSIGMGIKTLAEPSYTTEKQLVVPMAHEITENTPVILRRLFEMEEKKMEPKL